MLLVLSENVCVLNFTRARVISRLGCATSNETWTWFPEIDRMGSPTHYLFDCSVTQPLWLPAFTREEPFASFDTRARPTRDPV